MLQPHQYRQKLLKWWRLRKPSKLKEHFHLPGLTQGSPQTSKTTPRGPPGPSWDATRKPATFSVPWGPSREPLWTPVRKSYRSLPVPTDSGHFLIRISHLKSKSPPRNARSNWSMMSWRREVSIMSHDLMNPYDACNQCCYCNWLTDTRLNNCATNQCCKVIKIIPAKHPNRENKE